MLVSLAKSKHLASLMQNRLFDKIIFSVRYLEIRLYSDFSKFFEKAESIEIGL